MIPLWYDPKKLKSGISPRGSYFYQMTKGSAEKSLYNTKNPLNYGNLSPQNRIYQSFCGDFFSIILMVFIINNQPQKNNFVVRAADQSL